MNAAKFACFVVTSIALGLGSGTAVLAQGATASLKVDPHYHVTVFAQSGSGYSAPDSIAVLHHHVFVGYGNNIAPDGTDGKSSNIVEYTLSGEVVHVYTVVGHNDGLKVNPITHELWAMQNEDASPNLVIINPVTHAQTVYTFGPTPHGGGYDDIVFLNGAAYFSASNPANNPNTAPAIVKATFSGGMIDVSPFMEANVQATDVVTGQSLTLNLQDPDSMTLDPNGNILLDSQADAELLLVRHPGKPSQSVLQIPLTSPFGSAQADDTLFVPNSDGFILVSDTPANVVYVIHKGAFAPGSAYTAAVGGTTGFVGRLDLEWGQLTPIVTGLQSPHGMGFVSTGEEDDDKGDSGHSCDAHE
jgi:hypothetical protein